MQLTTPSTLVTLASLMQGEPYTPTPGLAYELSGGKQATLRAPTIALTRQVDEMSAASKKRQDEGDTARSADVEIALAVTTHDGITYEEAIVPVASQIAVDFFRLRTPALQGLVSSEQASAPSSPAQP